MVCVYLTLKKNKSEKETYEKKLKSNLLASINLFTFQTDGRKKSKENTIYIPDRPRNPYVPNALSPIQYKLK